MPEVPTYPNLEATFGTSVPLVTALSATVSIALLVAAIAGTGVSVRKLGQLPWTTQQMAITTGLLATIFFLVATVCAIYAHSIAIDEVPADRQSKLFPATTPPEIKTKAVADWQRKSKVAYKVTQLVWLWGIGLLLLTLGVLAHQQVPVALPVTGILGGLAIVLGMDKHMPFVRVRLPTLVFGAAVFLLGISTVIGLHF